MKKSEECYCKKCGTTNPNEFYDHCLWECKRCILKDQQDFYKKQKVKNEF